MQICMTAKGTTEREAETNGDIVANDHDTLEVPRARANIFFQKLFSNGG